MILVITYLGETPIACVDNTYRPLTYDKTKERWEYCSKVRKYVVSSHWVMREIENAIVRHYLLFDSIPIVYVSRRTKKYFYYKYGNYGTIWDNGELSARADDTAEGFIQYLDTELKEDNSIPYKTIQVGMLRVVIKKG